MKSFTGFFLRLSTLALVVGCVFTLSANALAGGGKLTGVVADSVSGDKLSNASVTIAGVNMGAATDDSGQFFIIGIPPGTYDVKIVVVGYNPLTITGVVIESDVTTSLKVALSPMALKIKAQTITYMKPGVKVAPSTTQDLLDNTKGFKVDAEGQYHVRGSREGGVAMLSESARALSRSSAGAEEIDILSGGFNAQYGSIPNPTPRAPWNTEEYDRIYDNEFTEVIKTPLSTFSIDVDAASYSNTRRFLSEGQLPPPDAVRIEELINYFDYDYPCPTGEVPFSITTELADCPWMTDHKLLHVGLQGKRIVSDNLPPSNLTFLIDVSGSMQPPNKLPLLKSAFRMLAEQMRKEDRVAIVVYASATGLVLPSTSGKHKDDILAALDRLSAGGTTAGGAGMQLAYQTAKDNFIKGGNNRVIWATDGDFNTGVSSTSEMVRMIEDRRKDGVFLTLLGFGEENLKDSRMEQIADKGNGQYFYIDNIVEARKVMVTDLPSTLLTIAKDVKIQIEFNPAKVKAYRLIGYENRVMKAEEFHDDTKDAGEIGAGHSVTALYEIVPAGEKIDLPKVDELKYQATGVSPSALNTNEMLTLKLRYKLPDEDASKLLSQPVLDYPLKFAATSDNFRFSASVAAFGMLLRDSKFKGKANFADARDWAKGAKGTDNGGFRAEFVRMIETADKLKRPPSIIEE